MKKIFSVLSIAALAGGLATQLAAQEDKKAAGDAAKGKEAFEQCAVCHNVEGDEKKMGPSLAGLYKRGKLKNGSKVTDASVTKVINEGGNGMPAYADMLSDEERAHILAYLKTL